VGLIKGINLKIAKTNLRLFDMRFPAFVSTESCRVRKKHKVDLSKTRTGTHCPRPRRYMRKLSWKGSLNVYTSFFIQQHGKKRTTLFGPAADPRSVNLPLICQVLRALPLS
jgi:hypothetical protein